MGTGRQQWGMPAYKLQLVLCVHGGSGSVAAAAPTAGAGGWLLSLGDGEEKEGPPGSYCPWTSIWEVHA